MTEIGPSPDAMQFRKVREADLAGAGDAAMYTTWTAGMEHRGVGREFSGRGNLLKYYDCWDIWETLPRYGRPDPALVDASWSVTRRTFDALSPPTGHRFHKGEALPVDYINAEDFAFQTLGGLNPPKNKMCVMDFGAGMGRQVNIWSQRVSDLSWIAVDAIEMAYMAQRFHFSNVPDLPLVDYIDAPDSFEFDGRPAIRHLPTWRMDRIPENSVDLVLAVQVLPEIREDLVFWLLDRFGKILRPGGAIFIRDHDLHFLPGHAVDIEAELAARGYVREYRAYAQDRVDLHGIPRLWRKPNPAMPRRPVDKVRKTEIEARYGRPDC